MDTNPRFQSDNLQPGDRVLIVDGAFSGMEGTIISWPAAKALGYYVGPSLNERKMLMVITAIFGRDVSVVLEPHQMRRA
jgi:transcription antitermination factor NusG